MAENNNNGGKNTNIITKINDTISKVLGDFPPVVQTIAKIVVFGGLILLIAKAIGYIFPVIKPSRENPRLQSWDERRQVK